MPFKAQRLDTTPVRYAIQGLVPEIGIGFMYGRRGGGKSLIALAMSMSIGNDLPFMGQAVEPGSVLYCLGEGLNDAGIRLRGLQLAAAHDKISLSDANLYYEKKPFSLARPYDVDMVLTEWSTIKNLQVVILDVITQFTGGRSLTNDTSAALIMTGARRLSDALECAVLMLAHPVKNGPFMRGSGVLEDLADFVIKAEGGAIAVTKQKSGKMLPAIGYEIDSFCWDDPESGEQVSTAVIRGMRNAYGLDDDEDAPMTGAEFAAQITGALAKKYGLEESMTRIAIEQGIPLAAIGLADGPGDDDGEATGLDAGADDDEVPGLPRLYRSTELSGRRQKRTGLKPLAGGRLAVGK